MTERLPRDPEIVTHGRQPMEPPADASWLEMETIRGKRLPKHRVDPMRPANPHLIADDLLQSYYEERLREGRTGPKFAQALLAVVGCLLCAALFLGIVAAAWWMYAEWLS